MARGMHPWGFSGRWVTLPSHGPSPACLGLGVNLFLQQETCGPFPAVGDPGRSPGRLEHRVRAAAKAQRTGTRGGGKRALASPRSSSPTLRPPASSLAGSAGRGASVWVDPTTP